MWFQDLVGFREESPDQVRRQIVLNDDTIISKVNQAEMRCGRLEIPTLSELRDRVSSSDAKQPGRLQVQELVADVQQLHLDVANSNALFQVASQFNLLEMISPSRTPEDGIEIYRNDRTQGPACAIACGAGTIYRNYLVPVNEQVGQSRTNQIDCLAEIGEILGNREQRLWKMQNGYAIPSKASLKEIQSQLQSANESQLDELRGNLRIGLHWETEVTLGGKGHLVTQAYCSAMPVSYSRLSKDQWCEFASFILDAAYEATFLASLLNRKRNGCNRLFLTLLGGGAFGNDERWILEAIRRSLSMFADCDLDVTIVSYGFRNRSVQKLIKNFA